MAKKIPLVHLGNYTQGSAREKQDFLKIYGRALRDFGFVVVEGHGVSPALIRDGYQEAQNLFALPTEVKKKFEYPKGQQGYIRFGQEHAKDSPLEDLKEFWHIPRGLGEPQALPTAYVPRFAEVFGTLYQSLDELAHTLLEALSEFLCLPPAYLAEMATGGRNLLRVLHYPPLAHDQFKSGAVRAAAHEDINLITILCEATTSGLQLLTRDGKWLDVESGPGQMVVDSGDMLALLTNNFIPATTHRVINPPSEANVSRFSMPYFVHPRPECWLGVLPQCRAALAPARSTPRSADDYLQERLAAIGLGGKA